MIGFAELANERSLAQFIKSLFYDSNSDWCSFEFNIEVEEFSDLSNEILEIAEETIGKFDWFGFIKHGKPINEH